MFLLIFGSVVKLCTFVIIESIMYADTDSKWIPHLFVMVHPSDPLHNRDHAHQFAQKLTRLSKVVFVLPNFAHSVIRYHSKAFSQS